MAEADYVELETLFHSDLQTLDLQNEDATSEVSSHLPEWLIGVIVVVILLIVAFFAMVVYSLIKERRRNRAGSYGATTSAISAGENLELGKTDDNIRITAFTLEQPKDAEGPDNDQTNNSTNDPTWTLDAEVASTLQRRQHGPEGCMNPAFIDDDADNDIKKDTHEEESDSTQKENILNGIKNDENETLDNTDEAKVNSEMNEDSSSSLTSKSQSLSLSLTRSSLTSKSQSLSLSLTRSSRSDLCKKSKEEEQDEMISCPSERSESRGRDNEHKEILTDGSSTPDQEIASDEVKEDGDSTRYKAEDVEDYQSGRESAPGASCSSSSGVRHLEVVVDRDSPSSDRRTGVLVLEDRQGETGHENSQASSTDEKEDRPGTSTNL